MHVQHMMWLVLDVVVARRSDAASTSWSLTSFLGTALYAAHVRSTNCRENVARPAKVESFASCARIALALQSGMVARSVTLMLQSPFVKMTRN
jgi:hypothetical protein